MLFIFLCQFDVSYCICRIKHEIGSNGIRLVKSLKQDLKPKRMIWNTICPFVLIPASAKSTQILAVD
tara:strand:- start:219 stop:419 length:201 start_codon:yes stop_codon:yes gene_type:complete